MKLTRPLAAVATAALAVSLSACGGGGGSSAPDDASVEEFCEAYNSVFTDIMGDIDLENPEDIETPSAEESVESIKQWAEEMAEVGTPEDIPDEAREGFELFLEGAEDLEAEDLENPGDLSGLEGDLEGDEAEASQAFGDYTTENCGSPFEDMMGEMPDMPTEMPTDMPTDMPTEMPSDLLSDIPTELLSDLPTELLSELESQ